MRHCVLALRLGDYVGIRELAEIGKDPSLRQLALRTIPSARDASPHAIERVGRARAAREGMCMRVARERLDEVLDVGGRRRAGDDGPLLVEVDADELLRVAAAAEALLCRRKAAVPVLVAAAPAEEAAVGAEKRNTDRTKRAEDEEAGKHGGLLGPFCLWRGRRIGVIEVAVGHAYWATSRKETGNRRSGA